MVNATILTGDVLARIKEIPDNTIHAVSPARPIGGFGTTVTTVNLVLNRPLNCMSRTWLPYSGKYGES